MIKPTDTTSASLITGNALAEGGAMAGAAVQETFSLPIQQAASVETSYETISAAQAPQDLNAGNISGTLFQPVETAVQPLQLENRTYSNFEWRIQQMQVARDASIAALQTLPAETRQANALKTLQHTAARLSMRGDHYAAWALHRILLARGYVDEKILSGVAAMNKLAFDCVCSFVEFRSSPKYQEVKIDSPEEASASIRRQGQLNNVSLLDFVEMLDFGGERNILHEVSFSNPAIKNMLSVVARYRNGEKQSGTKALFQITSQSTGTASELINLSLKIDEGMKRCAMASHMQLALTLFMKRHRMASRFDQFTDEGILSWTAMGATIEKCHTDVARQALSDAINGGALVDGTIVRPDTMSDLELARLSITREHVKDGLEFTIWASGSAMFSEIFPNGDFNNITNPIPLGLMALRYGTTRGVCATVRTDAVLQTLLGGYIEKRIQGVQQMAEKTADAERADVMRTSANALSNYYRLAKFEYDILEALDTSN